MLRIVGRDLDASACQGCRKGRQETVLLEDGQQGGYVKRCRACAAKAVLGAKAGRERLDAILEALEKAVVWVNCRPDDVTPSAWAIAIASEVRALGVEAQAVGEQVVIEHAGALCPGRFVPV